MTAFRSTEGLRLLKIWKPCSYNDVRGACVLHMRDRPELMCENCQANSAASAAVVAAAKLRRRMLAN